MIKTLNQTTKEDLYRPAYNIQDCITIKQNDEKDYADLLLMLKDQGISKGSYMIESYRELDKPTWNKYLNTQHT
tara:strand:+ start:788 stop:1009 length:222 start_codon:yes stop_codon:yes gene_type:complete